MDGHRHWIDELRQYDEIKDKMDGHRYWINELRQYDEMKDKTDREVIIYALSYTLQSFRHNEDMNRFKWGKNDSKTI